MSFKNRVLQFLSRFTDRKISKGIGLTIEPDLSLKNYPSVTEIGKPLSRISPKYKLRTKAGQFELINIVKGKLGVNYKLRHTLTGSSFIITESLFKLLFEHSGRIKDKKDE